MMILKLNVRSRAPTQHLRHSLADKVVFDSESMSSAPKRKWRKRKDGGEEGASKYFKISDLFGKPPTADSDTKVSCVLDLAIVSLLFKDEVTFPTS